MTTIVATLPGQLAFADGVATEHFRSIGAEAGIRYKIVPIQIAAPANLDDAAIIDAINFALTYTQTAEGNIAHDWQFLARDGAVGDNDHFREAIIDEDDLFANTPQSIFENWYLIPDGSTPSAGSGTHSPTDGTQCPQCEKFFTAPEDIATIGDHALCTACLTAWRMTAAGSAGSPTDTTDGDDGDGYSDQPPFLPIPEWWAARGLEASTDDEAGDKKTLLTIDQVKDTLPNVQVKSHGKVYTAKVRGRRHAFAEVSWETDCGTMRADFAWQTVTNAINYNKELLA